MYTTEVIQRKLMAFWTWIYYSSNIVVAKVMSNYFTSFIWPQRQGPIKLSKGSTRNRSLVIADHNSIFTLSTYVSYFWNDVNKIMQRKLSNFKNKYLNELMSWFSSNLIWGVCKVMYMECVKYNKLVQIGKLGISRLLM